MMNKVETPVKQILASFSRLQQTGAFDRYRHTKEILHAAWRLYRSGRPDRIPSLMDHLGYRKKNKLLHRITRDWLTLQKPIPLSFPKAIGLSFRTLGNALSRDRSAYRAALRHASYPAYIACRVIPGFSLTIPMPAPTTEAEAVVLARGQLIRYRKTQPWDYALVVWPGLQEIRVTLTDTTLFTYPPRMICSGDRLCFVPGRLG